MAKALVILKLARGTVFRGMAPSIEDLMFSGSVGCRVCRVRGGRCFMQTVQKTVARCSCLFSVPLYSRSRHSRYAPGRHFRVDSMELQSASGLLSGSLRVW